LVAHHKKEFQNIMPKIAIIGTKPNLPMSSKWTLRTLRALKGVNQN